uniref:Annexin n=1 Tax=Oncorhynchus kisutch TaxID=8019 RepID=A0A8C7CW00_ONCKI
TCATMSFLQQTVYLGMADDSTQLNQGTVIPYPLFSADGDAGILDKAIKAKGVDENTIIDVLVKRSNAQRQQIKASYQKASGKPLETALKSALNGELEDVVLALLKTPAQYDAQQLKLAMKGLGTDEDTLIEILASRTNKEIKEIKKAYQEVHLSPSLSLSAFEKYFKYSKVDVTKAIDLELKGDIENCLTAVVKCAGSKPAFFAERLNLAMKGKGTRTKILTHVMVSRSEVDMARIKQEYKKTFGKTLYQDILNDTNGDYEKILLALCGSDS